MINSPFAANVSTSNQPEQTATKSILKLAANPLAVGLTAAGIAAVVVPQSLQISLPACLVAANLVSVSDRKREIQQIGQYCQTLARKVDLQDRQLAHLQQSNRSQQLQIEELHSQDAAISDSFNTLTSDIDSLQAETDKLNADLAQQQEKSGTYVTKRYTTPIVAKVCQMQRAQKAMQLGTIAQLQNEMAEIKGQFQNLSNLVTEAEKKPKSVELTATLPSSPTDLKSQNSSAAVDDSVAIFVDGNNLYYSAKELGLKVEMANLYKYLRGDAAKSQLYYYTAVDSRNPAQKGFLSYLRSLGFQVISKELLRRVNGKSKGNMDVELSVDMVEKASEFSKIVLVSGDVDFTHVVCLLQRKGKKVEVASFDAFCSRSLAASADAYRKLDDSKHIIAKKI